MRRTASALLLFALTLPVIAAPSSSSERALHAARALVAALSPAQQRRLQFSFDGKERSDLHLYPFFLDGLQARDMGPPAEQELAPLLQSLLSEEGVAAVSAVRSYEDEVARQEREKGGIWPLVSHSRDPGRYYLALFGEPATDQPWGWRFDGHHVSINATFVPGSPPSVTPFFLGSQPRAVNGQELLGREEALGLALALSLDAAQRELGVLPFEPKRAMFLGKGPRLELPAPVGLARADMRPEQQALLDQLVDAFLSRVNAEIADAARARYAADGPDRIRFARAGAEQLGQPCYFRVQGPRFLLEFDNSLPGADHIHTIWREQKGDFGADLLALHHQAEHASD